MTTMNNNDFATINNTTHEEKMNIMKETTTQTVATMEQPTPIVQEADFPQQPTRLQQIMSRYRRENNVPTVAPATMPTKVNPLANVKISTEVKTKKFEDLRPEIQQKVLARIDGIDYMKSADIQNFGSSKQSPMTKHAEIIISKYSASDVGELADPMTDLVATLKSKNPKEIVRRVSVDPDKELGVLSSFREMLSMKKAKKKMFKALAEHDTIKKNINAIEVELEKQKIDLTKDVATYEQMEKDTIEQITEFELDCIALYLMREDAQAKLDALVQRGTLDDMELNDANALQKAIDRIDRRIYIIQTIRVATIQSIPQLRVLVNGDEIICEKIDEVSSLVIPLWTWQYAIAIGALKQKEALSIQKTIRGITSKLLTGNAKMLHDNMIAAQNELYAAAVAIEDLVVVQEYIDDMVTKVNDVRNEASQKCVEGMKTMKAIEQKNYDLMSKGINTATEVQ